ncbi:MAG: hypothetical protein AW09_004083 [Candidatus Accumulibacter phosphatis]|uniref:Uncharacterized protein n=1 Tax=Candidatus Accumulibacter phosphatis TaxID=327160 RepID=A0A080LT91_9PROT|nr:MAG: hypothetical protein AW09_004083 [Candidatus Accumulibacter phosphatis]
MAGEADARVGQAPMQEQGQPDEADHAGDAAGHHRHHLLALRRNERLVEPMRRQQADGMAHQQEQDADVEEVAAPAQCAGAQHLR